MDRASGYTPRMNSTDDPRGLGNAGRVLVAAGVVAVVVSVALAAIGAVRGPVLPVPTVAAPPVGPASIAPSRPLYRVSVDPLSRRLTVDRYLTGQLPGKPFVLAEPTSSKGLFTEATLGGLATDSAWKANVNMPLSVIVADLEPKTVVAGDLDATGRGVVAELAARLYRSLTDLRVRDVRSDPETAIGRYPARWSHATVTGALASGAAERAELSLLLVALPNGRHFAFVEVRPDHPDAAQHVAALDRAAASIVAVG